MFAVIRKIFAAIFAVMIICSLNFCEAAKKIVAVMPLENVSGYTEQKVAEIMTEQLIVAIHSSGIYTVVEREQLGTVLREQGFQNIAVDPNKAVELGKLSGADYTLVGKVTMADGKTDELSDALSTIGKIVALGKIFNGEDGNFGNIPEAKKSEFKISVELRFIDNTTGEIVLASSVAGEQKGENNVAAMNSACKNAAENFFIELQKNNPLVARIADISGADIYIDKGSDDGLRQGEILIISRETSPIMVNGKIVGMKSEKIGRAQVVEVNAEYSICKIIEQYYPASQGDILKRS